MAASSKRAPMPSDTPLSVRVQVYSHEKLCNSESRPLANFRLRLSSSATFADLSATVIDRYERALPGGSQSFPSEVCVVLDEKDCAFDMSDPIDIVQPNEFIRFVLAASPSIAAAPATTNQTTRPSSESEPASSSIPATPPTARAAASREPRNTPVTTSSSDLVEVDANGTPTAPSNSKSKDDELQITGVRSSQAPPSSPTRPASKPFPRPGAKPVRNGNSVMRQLQLQGRTPSTARTPVTTPHLDGKRQTSTPLQNAPSAATDISPRQQPARTPAPVTPARAQTRGTTPTAGTMPTAGTTPAAGFTQAAGDGGRRGQRDPYEVPSDNEVQLVAQRKTTLAGVRTPRPRAVSMNSATRGNTAKPNVQNVASTTPTAPTSLPKTPHKGPSDANTALSSAGSLNNSRHHNLKQIAEGAKTIQLSDSQSESNSTDASEPAPAPLSSKALGKLSHHSVNGHLDIVGPTPQPQIPKQPSKPIMIRHSRGVTPVYRKDESSSSPAEIAGEPPSSNISAPSNTPGPTSAPEQRTAQQGTAQKAGATQLVKKLETVAATKQPRTPTAKVSPEAAVEHAKSRMSIKFGKKATEPPIPDAFFAERQVSDDKYIPGSSDENNGSDESSNDEVISEVDIKRTLRRSVSVPPYSHDNNNGKARSFTRERSQGAVTPRNTLRLRTASSQGSVQSTPRFHRGYSKRVRDTFNDASVPSDPEEEGEEEDDDDQSSKPEKRPDWWNPIGWMHKYRTEFGSPHMELATGPFKGCVVFGPKIGTYLPGYAPPSDEEIIEAEKTAVLKDDPAPLETMPDGSLPDGDEDVPEVKDTDGEATIRDTTSEENGVDKTVVNKLAVLDHDTSEGSDNSDDLPSSPPGPEQTKIPESPAKTDNVPNHKLADTPAGGDNPPSRNMGKSAEWLERLDRTAQYVLDHASPTARSSPDADGFGSADLAPAPAKGSSPPSGASESTSVLITRQLTRDSASVAPPSNQELAVLMSSSPATVRARNATPFKGSATAASENNKESKTPTWHDTADLEDSAASSTESSVGIPARLPPATPTRPRRSVYASQDQTPRTPARPGSPGLHSSPRADFILSGISQRRTTRSIMRSPSPGARPNYRIPGINEIGTPSKRTPSRGTPSKPARPAAVASPVIARRKDEHHLRPSFRSEAGPSSEDAALVVELPSIAAEKRAEFDVVSEECHDSAVTATTAATVTTANGDSDDTSVETGGNNKNYNKDGNSSNENSNDKDSQPKIVHPLKSFQDINEAPGTPLQRQPDTGDGAENVLDYVLRESPSWLSNITEVETAPGVTERRPRRALARPSLVPVMPTFSTDSASEVDDDSTSNSAEDDVGSGDALCAPPTAPSAVVEGAPLQQTPCGSNKRKRAATVPDDAPAHMEITSEKHDTKRHKHKEKKQRESVPASASPPSRERNRSGERTRKRKRVVSWRETTRSPDERQAKARSGAEPTGTAVVSPVDGGKHRHHHHHVEPEHEEEPPNKKRKHASRHQGEEQQQAMASGGKSWKKQKKSKQQKKEEKRNAKAAAAEEKGAQELSPLPPPLSPSHPQQLQQDDSEQLTKRQRKRRRSKRRSAAAAIAAATAADTIPIDAPSSPTTATPTTGAVNAASSPGKQEKRSKNKNKNKNKKNRREEALAMMIISPPPTSRPSSAGSLRM